MRAAIKTLLVASMMSTFAFGLLGPIYAIYVGEIGGDILDTSGSWAIYMFVTGVLIIFMGKIEDSKLNKPLMIVLGYFISAMAALGYIYVQTPAQLFIVQFALGVATATMTPAWDAIYSRSLDKGKEGFEWSLWEGGTNIFAALAAIAGGLIVTFASFHTLFIIMFVLSMTSAFVSIHLFKDTHFRRR